MSKSTLHKWIMMDYSIVLCFVLINFTKITYSQDVGKTDTFVKTSDILNIVQSEMSNFKSEILKPLVDRIETIEFELKMIKELLNCCSKTESHTRTVRRIPEHRLTYGGDRQLQADAIILQLDKNTKHIRRLNSIHKDEETDKIIEHLHMGKFEQAHKEWNDLIEIDEGNEQVMLKDMKKLLDVAYGSSNVTHEMREIHHYPLGPIIKFLNDSTTSTSQFKSSVYSYLFELMKSKGDFFQGKEIFELAHNLQIENNSSAATAELIRQLPEPVKSILVYKSPVQLKWGAHFPLIPLGNIYNPMGFRLVSMAREVSPPELALWNFEPLEGPTSILVDDQSNLFYIKNVYHGHYLRANSIKNGSDMILLTLWPEKHELNSIFGIELVAENSIRMSARAFNKTLWVDYKYSENRFHFYFGDIKVRDSSSHFLVV